MKRMHARAKGRGTRIIKRTSHITVVVGPASARRGRRWVRKSSHRHPPWYLQGLEFDLVRGQEETSPPTLLHDLKVPREMLREKLPLPR
jgi:hypothetical protein